ncbi:MAG TPA: phosphoribosylanthranilate isomerase [Gemmataceae bacterium]|nr:phosphoribosylanthranilate isomerase [Gemmataceae bacterium]
MLGGKDREGKRDAQRQVSLASCRMSGYKWDSEPLGTEAWSEGVRPGPEGEGSLNDLRIKICGITNEADGRHAALLGADAIGLNFYPGSPRCIDVATAAAVLRELPPFVEAVGLFVHVPLAEALESIRSLDRIRSLQWYCERHEPMEVSPYRLIPAFSVGTLEDLQEIASYVERCRSSELLPVAVLVDAQVAGQYGGTGRAAPWGLLADFRPRVPLILAGGLTPENVAEAVRIVRPYAVDVASGVELSPGRKDPVKMRRFIDSAREAAAKYC